MSEDTTFQLATESQTVGPTEMARIIGRELGTAPTAQTVRNHADKRTITGTKTADGWKFDPAVVVAEWRANVRTTAHGGRRRNAGRKTATPEPALTKATTRARDALEDIREQNTPDADGNLPEHPRGAMLVTDLLRLTEDQLDALVAVHVRGRAVLDNTHIDRLEAIKKLQRTDLQLKKEKGELVEAAKVADAWRVALAGVANALESMPKRVSSRVAAACWPGDNTRKSVAQTLKAAGVEPAVISAVLGILAQPPELVGRVRQMLDKEVGDAMHAIAEGGEGEEVGNRQ
jgi:hypothetical protein